MTADQFAVTCPWVNNSLQSKPDVAAFLYNVLDASPRSGRLRRSSLVVVAHMGTYRWVNGFASGTNTSHPEFRGTMRDRDQRMVDWVLVGRRTRAAMAPPRRAVKAEFSRLARWHERQRNAKHELAVVPCYLRFGAARMKADLDYLDPFYIGGGWSRDGPEGVVQLDDYSSSFAIQVVQLVHAKIIEKKILSAQKNTRSGHANSHWTLSTTLTKKVIFAVSKFTENVDGYVMSLGKAIPFGRWMVYRCAMSAFWSALAFSLPEPHAPLTWGQIKGLQLHHIHTWMKTPGARAADDTLTCHLVRTTWALEKPLHILTNAGGHTFLLSSGQQCAYPVRQSAAKYGKFAYSSPFSWSVPVAALTLEEQATDFALARSDDDGETWKVRRQTKEARIEGGRWLRSVQYPWPDVEVETWLVPPSPSAPLRHPRVHRIRSSRGLCAADGGRAIHGQREDERALEPATSGSEYGTLKNGPEARAVSKAGVSSVVDLSSTTSRASRAMRSDAN
ncbi:hypothetical protein BS17DRAFT_769155 [Gyrodon lividus]|nr:hypothetical protein BS17DRAFT_769155 [Gyrodon lividus]